MISACKIRQLLLRITPKVTLTSIHNFQIRHLYSAEELGIRKYEESRNGAERALKNHEFFKQNMKTRLTNPKYELLLLESDLRNFLHLMTNSKNDLQILQTALYQLVQKRPNYQGDKYRVGTVIMRVLHFLKMPEQAMMFFDDENLALLFDQAVGYQILLDLLYEHQKYNDVLRIYDKLTTSGRIHSNKYIDVIIFATYYRMNTFNAYEKALDLWQSVQKSSDEIQFRKSRTFVAGLAVNQRRPSVALDILKGKTMYVSMRNIKLMAWAQTGQYRKILNMLNATIELYKENNGKIVPSTSAEVLMVIEKAILHGGTPEDKASFRNIHEVIKSLDLITTDSFDDVICAPFTVKPPANTYFKQK